jgi:hypothetical protein
VDGDVFTLSSVPNLLNKSPIDEYILYQVPYNSRERRCSGLTPTYNQHHSHAPTTQINAHFNEPFHLFHSGIWHEFKQETSEARDTARDVEKSRYLNTINNYFYPRMIRCILETPKRFAKGEVASWVECGPVKPFYNIRLLH